MATIPCTNTSISNTQQNAEVIPADLIPSPLIRLQAIPPEYYLMYNALTTGTAIISTNTAPVEEADEPEEDVDTNAPQIPYTTYYEPELNQPYGDYFALIAGDGDVSVE